jgi:MOSC domain-containing protein YiiM
MRADGTGRGRTGQTVPMTRATLRTSDELAAHMDHLRAAPAEMGTLDLVVRRPANGEREVLDEGVLDEADGLVGDNWLARATSRAVVEGRHLKAQVTVMSSRMIRLLADTDEERALAGDQLYVDLDISYTNLHAGSRIALGDPDNGGAVIEVSDKPHTGCAKFVRRFGDEAVSFINSDVGKEMRLRGLNARVVSGGTVRPGDPVRRL